MRPHHYFPGSYLADIDELLRVWGSYDSRNFEVLNPFSGFCNMSFSDAFLNGTYNEFVSYVDFFCTGYALELINQGIYTYFPKDHGQWLDHAVPLIRFCGCYHGPFVPYQIIEAIRSYDKNTRHGSHNPQPTDELVAEYTKYFLYIYLEFVRRGAGFVWRPSHLAKFLRVDPDCPEVSRLVDTPEIDISDRDLMNELLPLPPIINKPSDFDQRRYDRRKGLLNGSINETNAWFTDWPLESEFARLEMLLPRATRKRGHW